MRYELGILGAGNMAEAIARGLLRSGVFGADQILASDISADRRTLFQSELGIRAVNDPIAVARDAHVLLLAVKPQTMNALLDAIADATNPDATIVSIAAGVTCARIESKLAPRPVVRTMPNTPLMIGDGATAIAAGTHAGPKHLAQARRLFDGVGVVVEVSEDQLDAVTAVSGSGPAYFFYLVEQMVRAGVELGLSPEVAHKLATHTARGAGRMLAESGDDPKTLRAKVTSPNGTTHAAIEHLRTHDFGSLVVDALKAADARSKELGRQ